MASTTLASVESAILGSDGVPGTFTTVSAVTLPAARSQGVAVVSGSGLYVIGGLGSAGTPLATTLVADINGDGTISTFRDALKPLQIGRGRPGVAHVGKALYVFGGSTLTPDGDTIERTLLDGSGAPQGFSQAAFKMTASRALPTAEVIGNHVYVLGGADPGPGFERGQLATGGLGAFVKTGTQSLTTDRAYTAHAAIGGSLYVVGGDSAAATTTSDRFAVAPDGKLGSPVAGPMLDVWRRAHALAVIGDYVYAFGGQGTPPLDTVARATIDANGALGNFWTVAGLTLVTGRSYAAAVVIEDNLYVIGGSAPGATASIERAPIKPDFTLDPFVGAGVLAIPRSGAQTAVIGDYVYVLGGFDDLGQQTKTWDRAPIMAGGSLGGFTTSMAAGNMLGNHSDRSGAVVGNQLYMLNGLGIPANFPIIERATVNADGTLGSFSSFVNNVMDTRSGERNQVLGDWYYRIGGSDLGGIVRSLDRAPLQ